MMMYRIARNGQVFGPYSFEQVQEYRASGNIVATDLAQPEGTAEWLPLTQVFPVVAAAPAYAVPALYPDPPNLPWWLALLAEMFSGFLFFDGWNVYTSAWLRRIDSTSAALYLYIAQAFLVLLNLPSTYHGVSHWIWGAPMVVEHHGAFLGLTTRTVRLVARFIFRRELLRHFNRTEPIGLRLSGVLTFFFGGLYFQYKFNEINRIKRMLQISVPVM